MRSGRSCNASAISCSSPPRTTCSRSAAAGAASRCTLRARTGCRVTGFDDLAPSRRRSPASGSREGLSDRVEILEQDYRTARRALHEGRRRSRCSRRSASEQFGTYFATIDRVLEPRGIACVQTILIPDDRWDRYRKAPDWIEHYVFPGCLIPSLTALTQAATASRD